MREDPGRQRPVNLISMPGKVMGKINLGVKERQLQNKATTRYSQHGSGKKSPALYGKVICLVTKGSSWTLLDFRKTFDTILHGILLPIIQL